MHAVAGVKINRNNKEKLKSWNNRERWSKREKLRSWNRRATERAGMTERGGGTERTVVCR